MTANAVIEAQPTNATEIVEELIRVDRASKRLDARRKVLSEQLIELGKGKTYETATTKVSVDCGTTTELDTEALKAKYPAKFRKLQMEKAETVKITVSDASKVFAKNDLEAFIKPKEVTARIVIRYKQVRD